jgi:hypothetical protein
LLQGREKIPVIYVVQNAIGLGSTMSKNKKLFHPGNEVIFEGSFDDLVEKIGCDKLMDVSTRKIVGKGLEIKRSNRGK